jgi:serine/threonine protein kinase
VLLKAIGKGSYSTVYEARLAPNESREKRNEVYAIKQISL